MTRSIIPWKKKGKRNVYAVAKANTFQMSASIKAHQVWTVIAKPSIHQFLKCVIKYK